MSMCPVCSCFACTPQLDAALLDLSSYTHLAFTSKNGILAVLQRLQQLKGGECYSLSSSAALACMWWLADTNTQLQQHHMNRPATFGMPG